MGLTTTEQAVLDRYDRGASIDQISRATGFPRTSVQDIVRRYDVNLAQDNARELAVRMQSARLAQRVLQEGGHR